jgi:hypothetical protein
VPVERFTRTSHDNGKSVRAVDELATYSVPRATRKDVDLLPDRGEKERNLPVSHRRLRPRLLHVWTIRDFRNQDQAKKVHLDDFV